MGVPPGSRVGQPDRLHRAEPKCLPPALGHFLHRQTALEVGNLVEFMSVELVSLDQCVDEAAIGVRVHRGVEVIVAFALAIPRQRVEPAVVE